MSKLSIKQKLLIDTKKIDKANNIKNQLKILTNVKKYFLHTYIGHEENGRKQPPIINKIPQQLIIFINDIDKLIKEIESMQESAEN